MTGGCTERTGPHAAPLPRVGARPSAGAKELQESIESERMKIRHLVTREIWHSKLSFAVSLLSVVIAIGVLTGAFTLLQAHEVRTGRILDRKQEKLKQQMAALNEDMRKATLELGFNLLVLPEDQDVPHWFGGESGSRYMPEDYAKTLAESDIITVRHLLPILQEKVTWPEKNRTIILAGTRGEVPKTNKPPKAPFAEQTEGRQGVDPVPRGSMILGYQLHSDLGIEKGQTVELMDREFTVQKCHPERGSEDDFTVWINLEEAQEMLDKEDRITAILALQCLCPGSTIEKAKSDIMTVLPHTQVRARVPEALSRIQARRSAARRAKAAIDDAKESRAELKEERQVMASVLASVVLVASAVWIGLMAMVNVNQRRGEIALLRAVGLRARHILGLFLSKAVLLGLVGGALGYAAGFLLGRRLEVRLDEASSELLGAGTLFDPTALALALVLAPCLAVLATWIPAMLAARQDPADVLREE